MIKLSRECIIVTTEDFNYPNMKLNRSRVRDPINSSTLLLITLLAIKGCSIMDLILTKKEKLVGKVKMTGTLDKMTVIPEIRTSRVGGREKN